MVDSSRQPQDRNLVLSIQSVIDRWEILRIATKSIVYDNADETKVLLYSIVQQLNMVRKPYKLEHQTNVVHDIDTEIEVRTFILFISTLLKFNFES